MECWEAGGQARFVAPEGLILMPAHLGNSSMVAQMVKNPPTIQETWVQSLGWDDRLEEGMFRPLNVLSWRIPMDRGAWWTVVRGVAKSQI